MKVAIVHDSFAEFGGAERVVNVLLELFPDADLYTAFNKKEYRVPRIRREKFHMSWIQPFPVEGHTSFVQAIAPLIWRSFRFDAYDLVISHGNHLMSNLIHVPHAVHITFIETPPKNIIGMTPLTPLQRFTHYERIIAPIYRRALRDTPYVVVNSQHMRRVIRQRTGVDTAVIYPPVIVPPRIPKKRMGKFYLCVSRLAREKNLELAILAATKLRVPLKIAGISNNPSYDRYLHAIAGPTVTFLGFRFDDMEELYAEAIAFLFPSLSEDFGIAPLEATAHGVPVIAYYGGGTKETVIEGKTGTFFHAHTAASLIQAIGRIKAMRFDPNILYAHAKRFGVPRFKREFMDYVKKAVANTPSFPS